MIEMNTLHKLMVEKFTEQHFEVMLQLVDRLHDAAAVDNLEAVTQMDVRTIIGWLDDIIFTAEETIRELQGTLHPANLEREWSDN